MNKRLHKKKCDVVSRMNRRQLKGIANRSLELLRLEIRTNQELTKDIIMLETVHEQLMEERNKDVKRVKDFNNNLTDKLENKITECAELEEELSRMAEKHTLLSKKYEQAKEVVESMEHSLENKNEYTKSLEARIEILSTEVSWLKTPWYKRRGANKCRSGDF